MTTQQTATPAVVTTAELTELITSVYREALQDEGLDETSDFFECGGDSLAAFQITGRIEREVGGEVPVALVFAYPTPEELAEAVAEELGGGDERTDG